MIVAAVVVGLLAGTIPAPKGPPMQLMALFSRLSANLLLSERAEKSQRDKKAFIYIQRSGYKTNVVEYLIDVYIIRYLLSLLK